MPKLKQPASLEAISMDFLVEFVFRYLDQLNARGSEEEFRQGVAAIKKDVRDRIPRHFLSEFTTKFLQEWRSRRWKDHARDPCPDTWRESICKAALEMLMDVKIVGLYCGGEILECVDTRDMHRLSGVATLDICWSEELPILENCCMNDLTTLFLPGDCTDHHLQVIGQNCPKLRRLDFKRSKITDEGLRALDPCRELRSVRFEECDDISHVGINHLLSAHDKLQGIHYKNWIKFAWNQPDGCHFLSCLEKPYSSLKYFCIGTIDEITDAHLHSIVVNFPNLTRIELIFQSIADLSILKSLSHLEEISLEDFGMHSRSVFPSVWQSLKDLLTIIGRNITNLEFHISDDESYLLDLWSLDHIYKFCPNIEKLVLENVCHDLLVPPFRNLKSLFLSRDGIDPNDRVSVGVESIGAMSNLETFEFDCYTITADTIKSMMLDDAKFPKLRTLYTGSVSDDEYQEIQQITISRNIDFELWGC